MKFCCTSSINSKQRKSLNKNNEKKLKKTKEKIYSSSSSSSSSIYYTNMSIGNNMKKSDSGFSETATTLSSMQQSESLLEQILSFEKIYYENLKQYIIKYSRPLRRYLNPDDIVDLFQNIEKISAISDSIVRQCEKLFDTENASNIPISLIYQSWSGVMIDSYNAYLSRSVQAHTTLKQCQNKIAYFLQIPMEYISREITDFILLPIRHICLLNDLFQSEIIANSLVINGVDRKIIEDIRLLALQANVILQSSCVNQHDNTISTLESSVYCAPNVTLETSQDTTLQSEITSTIVLQRTNKEPWEPKRLELSDSKLLFTCIDRTDICSSLTTSVCLANVVHIQEDRSNEELRLVVAATVNKSSKYSSVKMIRVHVRFEHTNEYSLWFHHLSHAIQQAKDQSWSKKNELVI
ncbi:unnamed protein product [Rotaria magnacalcarata]|uniref:DH domain-containing protein n=4 Tax=Rotaria magnacalcarata TaxID=392030 RepID=A0A816ZYQ2_9BILA|nr:unnamed protein product [Rotaria magnacalcarata]CAF2243942.1 unnamed protein product [Rotaria magnacalcarata]